MLLLNTIFKQDLVQLLNCPFDIDFGLSRLTSLFKNLHRKMADSFFALIPWCSDEGWGATAPGAEEGRHIYH